jgi:hypothetical protein
MCLRTEQIEPQIATEDIICYKVICKDMSSLFHPEFKWEFGKVYHTVMTPSFSSFLMKTLVEKGFHSYSTLDGTREAYYSSTEPCIAVKCTIPKGSEYYTGNHGGVRKGYAGYASGKIIINEIIPVKELYPYFNFDKYPYKVDDKVIIKFAEGIPNVEGVIENIQPSPADYRVHLVDMIVSLGSKYMYISAKFDGKEFKVQRQVTHPITGQDVTIEEIKIKED